MENNNKPLAEFILYSKGNIITYSSQPNYKGFL